MQAKSLGLRVNAGHDLNLENLPALKTLNLIDEVSIGHAIIVDALNYGFEDTIKRYIQITKG
jgi:pyridoxine 5-phosphate synthase